MSQNVNTEFLSDDFDNFIKYESEKLERFSDFSPNQVEIQEPIKVEEPLTTTTPVEKKLSNFHPAPWHSGSNTVKEASKTIQPKVVAPSVDLNISSETGTSAETVAPVILDNKVANDLPQMVKLAKSKGETLFKDIYNLFGFNFFGKDKNLLKIFALLTILVLLYNGGKSIFSPDTKVSKIQAAIVENSGRDIDIDQAYQQLINYMETHVDSDNFTPKGKFNLKRQPGMLIITSQIGDCWYFGAVGSKIFEPRLDSTSQKCNLSNF